MRAIRPLVLTTSLFAAVTARVSTAQQDQVPKELALALIPMANAQGGEIIVGMLPPDLAASVTLPSGGRILGSFMTLGYGQSVIALPLGEDSARAFVRRSLVEHGWAARPPMGARAGGLQYMSRTAEPTLLCRPGTQDALTITSQFHGRETLVRLTRRNDAASCETMATGAVRSERVDFVQVLPRDRSYPLSTLPPLWSPGDPMSSIAVCHPPGTTTTGALTGQSQQQSLRSQLSPDAILAFYGKQLDSAGWKPKLEDPNESVSRTWTKVTASGDTAQDVTLTVSRMSTPGCYQVELRARARGPIR